MGAFIYSLERKVFSKIIDAAFRSLPKEREAYLLQLTDLAESYMEDNFSTEVYEEIRKLIHNPDTKWMRYVNRVLDETDPHVAKMMALNLGYQVAFLGTKTIRKNRELHGCHIPWIILMDLAGTWDFHCTGYREAEYGNEGNLTCGEMDSVISQGKELGIYFYMMTGGEPLVRKSDILELCKKHNDCVFHCFTDGTLVDQQLCDAMKKVGNLSLSIRLKESEEAGDFRRGSGVYEKAIHAMDLLHENGLIFGNSICCTRKNPEAVTSDEFFDLLIEHGSRFAGYFYLSSEGMKAAPERMPTREQREYIYHRLREVRAKEGGREIFTIDFQNDREFAGGCIAGDRTYCHMNINGDMEPCTFFHYSGANIRDNTLLDGLKYLFNKNMPGVCPMPENPER